MISGHWTLVDNIVSAISFLAILATCWIWWRWVLRPARNGTPTANDYSGPSYIRDLIVHCTRAWIRIESNPGDVGSRMALRQGLQDLCMAYKISPEEYKQ